MEVENFDMISLKTISKYITRGLSDYFETPSNDISGEFDKILSRMYFLDLLMKDIKDFDDLEKEVTKIYINESSKQEFFNNVIKNLKTINPLDTKENLEKQYKEQIVNLTYEKLEERLKLSKP